MAAVFRLTNNVLLKRLVQPVIANVRAISTSKKNSDTATTAVNEEVTACETKTSEKNWLRDWAQREAFLELRRREKAGLPLVDANLIDPSTVHEIVDTSNIIWLYSCEEN
ncbi:NP15.6 [Carabus blaptoides fortunei]